jgi:hypothetical protein
MLPLPNAPKWNSPKAQAPWLLPPAQDVEHGVPVVVEALKGLLAASLTFGAVVGGEGAVKIARGRRQLVRDIGADSGDAAHDDESGEHPAKIVRNGCISLSVGGITDLGVAPAGLIAAATILNY